MSPTLFVFLKPVYIEQFLCNYTRLYFSATSLLGMAIMLNFVADLTVDISTT